MIYFIQGEKTGLIKIGMANDVVHRPAALQLGSPDKLTILGVIEDADGDHKYHARFALDWFHSEWFYPSSELMSFISRIPESKYIGFCRLAESPSASRVLVEKFGRLPSRRELHTWTCEREAALVKCEEALSKVFEEVGDTI